MNHLLFSGKIRSRERRIDGKSTDTKKNYKSFVFIIKGNFACFANNKFVLAFGACFDTKALFFLLLRIIIYFLQYCFVPMEKLWFLNFCCCHVYSCFVLKLP
jgi:hypothetical protein